MRRVRHDRAATDGGFTLVELLIVIIIIGILAAVVALALPFVTGSATDNVCKAEYRSVESAMAAYETVNGPLPTTLTIDDLRPYTDGDLGQRWSIVPTGSIPVVTVVGKGDCL